MDWTMQNGGLSFNLPELMLLKKILCSHFQNKFGLWLIERWQLRRWEMELE